jgi:hypothetical protein
MFIAPMRGNDISSSWLPEVDDTFRARLEIADKISPAPMGAVNAAMERAWETALGPSHK